MKSKLHSLLIGLTLAVSVIELSAQNSVVTYQGRVQSGGSDFTGAGQFKFALVTVTNTATTATAKATLSGQFVTGFTITYGGSGYMTAPAVTITGGGGSGATATAVISGGMVTAINPVLAGSGYTSPPTVTIETPPETLAYTTFWSNDGTSTTGSEPAAAVTVPVSSGLFTVRLGDAVLANMSPLGAGLFTQPNLHLRLWFDDGVNGFAVLNPTQPLTATPYAFVAGGASNLLGALPASQINGAVGSANVAGTYANAVTFNNAANSFSGSGAGLANVNATLVDGLDSTAFWKLGGNNGTTAGSDFLGTTDNEPLELKVNDSRALRLEYASRLTGFARVVAPNVIEGSAYNVVSSGVLGAVIAGGGSRTTTLFQPTTTNAHLVSDDFGTIGGGRENTASGTYATIPGGQLNAATDYAFAAGRRAKANHTGTFVWADSQNTDFASTTSNQFNIRASGGARLVTAGAGMTVDGPVLTDTGSVTAPGFAFDSDPDTGLFNPSANTLAFATSGVERFRVSSVGNVGIGETSPAAAVHIRRTSSLSNPQLHLEDNGANGFARARLSAGTKPYWDIAAGGANNVINFFTSGGNGDVMTLTTNGNLTIDGTLTQGSDRTRKTDITPVEPLAVLEKVAALPLATWRYQSDAPERKHLGPMAQDFHAAFGLNGADDKHIATVDADGVALAAIQGLNQKLTEELKRRDAENVELKQRLEKLEQLIVMRNGGSR